MPETMQAKHLQTPEKKGVGKKIGIVAGIVAVLCVAVGLVLAFCLPKDRYEPAVIQGVKEQLTVFLDEDIRTILLDGVTAVGGEDRPGQTFPVEVYLYDEAGAQVDEYRPGTYRLVYRCEEGGEAETVLVIYPADTEPPVITGARDLTVVMGGTISYRSGVTATDAVDGPVQLVIDAGQVNLEQPGVYFVVYSAVDSRGNEARVTVTVTVEEPNAVEGPENPEEPEHPADNDVTREELDAVALRVLNQITTVGMTQRQKAQAIFNYVNTHITYVGTSDKSSWIKGAYVGLTQGRGDCFNYFACSKELLTLAGIPNIDLERTGGNTDHYWQLVNVGDGWYHFDACPHPTGYPLTAFLITEAAARAYTERCSSVRKNYYVYDYASCPVTVEGTPAGGEQPSVTLPPETEQPPEPTPSETLPPETEQPPEPIPPEPETPPEGEEAPPEAEAPPQETNESAQQPQDEAASD